MKELTKEQEKSAAGVAKKAAEKAKEIFKDSRDPSTCMLIVGQLYKGLLILFERGVLNKVDIPRVFEAGKYLAEEINKGEVESGYSTLEELEGMPRVEGGAN